MPNGEISIIKSEVCLWSSMDIIELYLGVGRNKYNIMVVNIRSKYKMVYKKNVKPTALSNVLIRYIKEEKYILKNLENAPVFDFKMRGKFIIYKCIHNFCKYINSHHHAL